MKNIIIILIAVAFVSCKPKQIINDRYITTVDSTSILTLKEVIAHQWSEIDRLKTTTERVREENVLLRSESSSHEINYDTGFPVSPETGKPPIQSETITHSKYEYDRVVTENETLRKEHNKEVNSLETKISNLELTVETLKQENSELQTKDIPRFHFKSFLGGIVAGMIMILLLVILLKR